MFTISERKPLHDSYFKLLVEHGNYAEVRSRKTRDTWRFRVEDGFIVTYHMPRGQRKYHYQCRSATIASAVKKISKHDRFVIRYRWPRLRK